MNIKSVIVTSMALLTLCGCNTSPSTKSTLYTPDLSGFTMIDEASDHVFGITPQGFIDACGGNGENGIYVMAHSGCSFCQYALPCLIEASNATDCPIYYLDTASEQYPLQQDEIPALYECLYPYLASDQSGEKQLMTPHVLALKDGQVLDSLVGLGEAFSGDQAAHQRLVDTYIQYMHHVTS